MAIALFKFVCLALALKWIGFWVLSTNLIHPVVRRCNTAIPNQSAKMFHIKEVLIGLKLVTCFI